MIHQIVTVRYARGENDGPLERTCGAEMLASEFADHRKAKGAGQARSNSVGGAYTGATPWKKSTPRGYSLNPTA